MLLEVLYIMLLHRCVYYVQGDDHYVQPTVVLESCLTRIVKFTITNCNEGGLIYVNSDYMAYNMLPTENDTFTYSCPFDECNIEWNQDFLVVIQRSPLVQTSHDVHLVFVCKADLSDIQPDDGTDKNKGDTGTRAYLFRARAVMRFYNDSAEVPSGSYVKLGSPLKTIIELTNNVEAMMDINVKSCEASGISLIDNRCPADEDLYGAYNKTGIGALWNEFSMFRTTTMGIEPVAMLFSCVLEVCYAPCHEYTCNGTEAVLVQSRRKRQTSGDVTRSLSVTTMFNVGTQDPVYVHHNLNDCIDQKIYVIVFSILAVILVSTSATAFYYAKELQRAKPSTGKEPAEAEDREGLETANKLNDATDVTGPSKDTTVAGQGRQEDTPCAQKHNSDERCKNLYKKANTAILDTDYKIKIQSAIDKVEARIHFNNKNAVNNEKHGLADDTHNTGSETFTVGADTLLQNNSLQAFVNETHTPPRSSIAPGETGSGAGPPDKEWSQDPIQQMCKKLATEFVNRTNANYNQKETANKYETSETMEVKIK